MLFFSLVPSVGLTRLFKGLRHVYSCISMVRFPDGAHLPSTIVLMSIYKRSQGNTIEVSQNIGHLPDEYSNL